MQYLLKIFLFYRLMYNLPELIMYLLLENFFHSIFLNLWLRYHSKHPSIPLGTHVFNIFIDVAF